MVNEFDQVTWTDDRGVVRAGVVVFVGDFWTDVAVNDADGEAEVWQVPNEAVTRVDEEA